jgi:hypothetical protein
VTRRAAVASGAVVLVAYLAGALVSARLSPFARGPLLDGLAPIAPYRWASPPPDLAATNKQPTPGTFTLDIGADGVDGGAFTTPDAQVTLIVPQHAFAPAPGQTSITLTIDQVAPSEGPPAPRGIVILGNLVVIAGTYEPSGDAVRTLLRPIEVVVLYPFVRSDSGSRLVLYSRDGRWKRLRATDHVGQAQLIASIGAPGTVAAAGRRASALPSPSPSASASPGRGAIIGVVAAAIVLIVLLVLALGRGGDRSRDR